MYRLKYKGKEYNLSELSAISGISLPTLRKRLFVKKMSVEDAVGKVANCRLVNPKRRNKKYECKIGDKTLGVPEVAKACNMNRNTVYKRILRGETLQQIMESPSKSPLIFAGKQYDRIDILNAAQIIGVTEASVKRRLKNGESLGDIIIKGRRSKFLKDSRKYPYKGEFYNLTEIMKMSEFDIPLPTMRSRLMDGWSVERAITTPSRPRKNYHRKFEYKGELLTLTELSKRKECKVEYGTLRTRLMKYHWSVERAMGVAPHKKSTVTIGA